MSEKYYPTRQDHERAEGMMSEEQRKMSGQREGEYIRTEFTVDLNNLRNYVDEFRDWFHKSSESDINYADKERKGKYSVELYEGDAAVKAAQNMGWGTEDVVAVVVKDNPLYEAEAVVITKDGKCHNASEQNPDHTLWVFLAEKSRLSSSSEGNESKEGKGRPTEADIDAVVEHQMLTRRGSFMFYESTKNQFMGWAEGETDEARDEYYPNWTDEDFKTLLKKLEKAESK